MTESAKPMHDNGWAALLLRIDGVVQGLVSGICTVRNPERLTRMLQNQNIFPLSPDCLPLSPDWPARGRGAGNRPTAPRRRCTHRTDTLQRAATARGWCTRWPAAAPATVECTATMRFGPDPPVRARSPCNRPAAPHANRLVCQGCSPAGRLTGGRPARV